MSELVKLPHPIPRDDVMKGTRGLFVVGLQQAGHSTIGGQARTTTV